MEECIEIPDEDTKDQDWARFFEPGQFAFVCDGVTSSLYAAQAAEMGTRFGPILFQGNTTERLGAICDALMAQRQESMDRDDISLPDRTPEAMRQMLRDVVRSKKAASFQTTIIAA